jgi:glutathione-specific gamma-glutamylcyclotransferase
MLCTMQRPNPDPLHEPIASELVLRDPEQAYRRLRGLWPQRGDCWVFGYASLIWRPEFEVAERRTARLNGWHRAFRMRSRVNRGTAQVPGLVFALLPGGSCQGVAYRLHAQSLDHELQQLWAREMPTGVYDARVVPCRTEQGTVQALAFTLPRRSPACLPPLGDAQLLDIFRHAKGRYGSTLDYLVLTAEALRREGVHDREIERQVALAKRHGLVQSPKALP